MMGLKELLVAFGFMMIFESLMPMISPRRLTKGPPLLPCSSGASICNWSGSLRMPVSAVTMPAPSWPEADSMPGSG